tara:strand:+ start:2528 stop:3415 length:888 start_codon:yes stop_codon:yes gene_type:complete
VIVNHSAEIKIHRYLEDVRKAKRGMSDATIARIVKDVKEAVEKQFKQNERKFTLRMSNIGRPYCQLWYDKNHPEEGVEPSANFLMNMMIGDIVEAVFKGVLTEAGVEFSDGFKSTLVVGKHKIDGTHDLIMDKRVDDIKSASPWSYKNKFKDYETLKEHDSFGYIGQLAGYSKALGVEAGGWWVVNKASGEFKYVSAWDMAVDRQDILDDIQQKADKLETNKFERCFEPVEETYRKKPTGNKVLAEECGWCKYRYKCWPSIQELPSLASQAKEKPIVAYVEIADENKESTKKKRA